MKGWTLQPTTLSLTNKVTSQLTELSNPSSLMLSENQIINIAPLVGLQLKKLLPKSVKTEKNVEKTITGDSKIKLGTYRFQFDEFYHQLHELYLEEDCSALETIASQHLQRFPIKKCSRLNPTILKIYRFFTEKGCDATQEELLTFFRSIPSKSFIKYIQNLFAFIDELKCQILAAQVIGELGHYECNLIDLYRSTLAFIVLASVAYKKDVSIDEIPIKYICLVLKLNSYLPTWTFEIDPCKCSDTRDSDTHFRKNLLAKKVDAKKTYDEKIKSLKKLSEDKFADGVAKTPDDVKRHPHPDCQDVEPEASECDCTSNCDPVCLPTDPCCANINYYVTDLMVLREKTVCYKPSDLAYIENVAPGESRVREHSFIKTVEDFTEEEATTSRTEERDHQVTDRFSLQQEIENNISASVDVESTFSYGKTSSITINASLSKDVAQKEARETFKEAVSKATLKIQSDNRKLQSRRVTTEESEKNKHKFKNETALPEVTKYFWVTQENEGQVFSHGLRGMVEFLIPSPAMLYQQLEKLKAKREFNLKKPKHPCLRIEDIISDKYSDYVVGYDLYELPKPPETPPIKCQKLIVKHDQKQAQVNIPNGYTASSMQLIDSKIKRSRFGRNPRLTFRFGGKKLQHKFQGGVDTKISNATLNVSTSGMATIDEADLGSGSWLDIKITFTPNPVDDSEWKLTVLKMIIEKYKEELRKYEEALAEHNRRQEDNRIQGRHPFAAVELVRAEIKRAAIYMMCDEFDCDDVMNLKSEPCGYPEINRSTAEKKTWDWYFFDRAFDWQLMSYKFYDYFRNPKCSWPDKFDPNDPNFMFNAFLRAGYVRVQCPITPAMDQDVLWYLNTKQKWGSGGTIPINPNDPRWVSVVEEIKHSYDVYQNDREGLVTAIVNTSSTNVNTNQVMITGSDRYWDPLSGTIDQNAINLDLQREIFVDGISYRIINIELDSSGPSYGPSSGSDMQWIVSLNRIFEGEAFADVSNNILKKYNYAIGAKYIGAPFQFELPTNLIWVGDHENRCLPCYPIECKLEKITTTLDQGD
jgi:hypothetical protein